MTLTNDAKAVVALTTRLGERKRPSLTAKMWHQLANALKDWGRSPADVFSHGFDPQEVPGVDPELATRIEALLGDGASATLEAEDLSRKGIWTITIVDDAYPKAMIERLGDQAPPVLFGCGDPDLMSTPGIGIVGSRDVDQAGAEVAMAVAREAVSLGLPVVSGGARGIDQLAMNAAFQAGGGVVGVLADSLIGRIRKPDTLEALDAGKTCLISQQIPSAGFTPASAMGRNKLVYALSDATVIVASAEESGGTWAGAVEAIRAGNGTVIVWRGEGEGPGNAALERLGGRTMTSMGDLASLIGSSEEPVRQLSLELPQ
jgi:predicted Rossmann fold nucleotide-binding protein DprA/Smf involved in DNA uptake